jgi:hypothetical protein
MRAHIGDRLVIHGHRIGEPERDGEILEVRGAGGEPPYLVRWSDDGHEGLVFPGSDAYIQSFTDNGDRP